MVVIICALLSKCFPKSKTSNFEYFGWKQFSVHCATILWMDHSFEQSDSRENCVFDEFFTSHEYKALSVYLGFFQLLLLQSLHYTGLVWIFHVGTQLGTLGLKNNRAQKKQYLFFILHYYHQVLLSKKLNSA